MKKFVRIIIEAQPQKYLLIREIREGIKERDTWNFPGGKVEDGETPLSAAKREFKEETNLDGEMELVLKAPVEFSFGIWEGYFYKAQSDFSKFKVMEKSKCIESALLSADEIRGKKGISSSIQIVLDKGLLDIDKTCEMMGSTSKKTKG